MAIIPYLDPNTYASADKTSRGDITPAVIIDPNTLSATGGGGTPFSAGIPPYLDPNTYASGDRTDRSDIVPIVLINPDTLEPYVASGGGGGGVNSVTATPPLESSGGSNPNISIQDGTNNGDSLVWNGSAWVSAPSGGGSATPTNGLQDIGGDIGLGGTLTQNTTIEQDGNVLEFNDAGTSSVLRMSSGTLSPVFTNGILGTFANSTFSMSSGGTSIINNNTGSFIIQSTQPTSVIDIENQNTRVRVSEILGINLKVSNGQGAVYDTDYSAGYVARSLVDKAYVDSVAGGGGVSPPKGISQWNFDATSQASNVSSEDFRINTVNPASATQVFISTIDELGDNREDMLRSLLQVGGKIIIEERDNGANHMIADITSVSVTSLNATLQIANVITTTGGFVDDAIYYIIAETPTSSSPQDLQATLDEGDTASGDIKVSSDGSGGGAFIDVDQTATTSEVGVNSGGNIASISFDNNLDGILSATGGTQNCFVKVNPSEVVIDADSTNRAIRFPTLPEETDVTLIDHIIGRDVSNGQLVVIPSTEFGKSDLQEVLNKGNSATGASIFVDGGTGSARLEVDNETNDRVLLGYTTPVGGASISADSSFVMNLSAGATGAPSANIEINPAQIVMTVGAGGDIMMDGLVAPALADPDVVLKDSDDKVRQAPFIINSLNDVDTTGAVDGNRLEFESGSWVAKPEIILPPLFTATNSGSVWDVLVGAPSFSMSGETITRVEVILTIDNKGSAPDAQDIEVYVSDNDSANTATDTLIATLPFSINAQTVGVAFTLELSVSEVLPTGVRYLKCGNTGSDYQFSNITINLFQ